MRPEPDPRIRHRIEPLWDTRNDAVTAYVCLADGMARQPAAEISALAAASARIGDLVEAGERFLVCVPVAHDMLVSAAREPFLAACGAMPASFRQYLVFILGGIPAAIDRAGLAEPACALRAFGRTIAILSPGCRDLAPYVNHAVSGLALDFGADFSDSERTRAVIGCAGEAAQDLRWGAMALRLDDPRLLGAVQAADFRFLHGAAAPRDKPRAAPCARPAIGTSPDAWAPRI